MTIGSMLPEALSEDRYCASLPNTERAFPQGARFLLCADRDDISFDLDLKQYGAARPIPVGTDT